tara:strand:+ start:692 stop:895 length:204 start_codon:yes stop_codon:yes gene_type:complete
MISHTVDIPGDCTEAQFQVIIGNLGLTHSEPDYIENDLSKLRGKQVKIKADKNKIIIGYTVPMPDPE